MSKIDCYSDVMCGTLHCQGGMDTPILTSGATGLSSTNTQVH